MTLASQFLSCSKDPDPINPLLGTWQYSQEIYSDCADPVDNGTYDFTCNDTDCFKVTFQDQGKISYQSLVSGVNNTTSGTYKIENSQVTICTTGCDNPVGFTVTGNTLSFIRQDNAGCTVTTVLIKI